MTTGMEREWENLREIDGESYVLAGEANRVADWLNDVMDGWALRGTNAENRIVRLLNAVDQAASDLENGAAPAFVARALRIAYVEAAGGQSGG